MKKLIVNIIQKAVAIIMVMSLYHVKSFFYVKKVKNQDAVISEVR